MTDHLLDTINEVPKLRAEIARLQALLSAEPRMTLKAATRYIEALENEVQRLQTRLDGATK